jgi:hypothetical protein
MSPVTAPPAPPAPPGTRGAGLARALFREARRRRRRRWLTGMAVALVASTAVTVFAVTWPHRVPGQHTTGAAAGPWGMATGARSSVTGALWFDGIRLHTGYIQPGGRVVQHAGAQVNASLLPLVQAGGRVYWADPAGAFVPSLGHWSQVVKYLDLATGKIGTAGPGQTVFPSADGRSLFMTQTATTVTQTPLRGTGAPRLLTLPRGWYLPGGDGLADMVSGAGLATANGILVQSRESQGRRAPVLAVWNPHGGKLLVLGRGRAVIGAYTPPGAQHSLLAWLPARCPPPGSCLLKITNTQTGAARTVRSPLPGGFAAGGAFSPDGTRLAVFLNPAAGGAARLALVAPGGGTVLTARSPRLVLGQDVGWARWLPGGARLIVGAGTGGYLVDAATLSARPLLIAPGHGQDNANSQDINFTVAVIPPRR